MLQLDFNMPKICPKNSLVYLLKKELLFRNIFGVFKLPYITPGPIIYGTDCAYVAIIIMQFKPLCDCYY